MSLTPGTGLSVWNAIFLEISTLIPEILKEHGEIITKCLFFLKVKIIIEVSGRIAEYLNENRRKTGKYVPHYKVDKNIKGFLSRRFVKGKCLTNILLQFFHYLYSIMRNI